MGYRAVNRRFRSVVFNTFAFVGLTFLVRQLATGQELPKSRSDLLNMSRRNQDRLARELRPMLKASGGAGRLYVRSKCLGQSGNLLFFPRIDIKFGSNRKTGIAGIQGLLDNNKEVKIAERQPGLAGIWIGTVSNDLLSTRIHLIEFGPRQRYNYYDAIEAIVGAKEIQEKMRDLQMDELTSFASYPILDPDPRLRCLPESMTNLTMDEALDQVARAFGGLVIYKECSGEKPMRIFSVDFEAIAESAVKEGL
jgi:hypothetical protein